MSNPGGSRRNGAMKIRLTSELRSINPDIVGRESHGLVCTHDERTPTYLQYPYLPTHLPTLGLFLFGHHSIWPRVRRVSFRGEASTRNVKTFGGRDPAYPERTITSFAVAPSPFWLCAYLRQRGRPHREHSPGDR